MVGLREGEPGGNKLTDDEINRMMATSRVRVQDGAPQGEDASRSAVVPVVKSRVSLGQRMLGRLGFKRPQVEIE